MALSREEPSGRPDLAVSREPVVSGSTSTPESTGSQALKDALIIVGICWAILLFLVFSLRAHNI